MKKRFICYYHNKIFFLIIFLGFSYFIPIAVWSQSTDLLNAGKENSSDYSDEFVNLGYISVSKKYVIAPNAKSITYKIRNNATRSISRMYVWIYEVEKKEENETPIYRLVNNPNKGGLPVKGSAHPSGKIEDWKFPLTAAVKGKTNVEYDFRISHRSIFFTNLERDIKGPAKGRDSLGNKPLQK